MAGYAPHDDLPAALASIGEHARGDLVACWVDRLVRALAPDALRQLGRPEEAAELSRISSEPLRVTDATRLWEIARPMFVRALNDRAPELVYFVVMFVDNGASALGHEAGTLRTVRTEWSEQSGPGAVIPWSPDELVERDRLRVVDVGCGARTVAHIACGERGLRDEVARQYDDLDRANRGEVPRGGDVWGMLTRGKRYRVYSSFVDLDGNHHPWGESWQFDGYVFCPASCELTLNVTDGVQLDPRGQPSHPIAVRPFRLSLVVGDRPGHPKDPIRPIITGA